MNKKQLKRRDVLAAGIGAAGTVFLPCVPSPSVQAQGRRGRRGDPLNVSPDNPALAWNPDFCEMCGDCRVACRTLAGVEGFPVPAGQDSCIYCGQCTQICPGMALTEKFQFEDVTRALDDDERITVALMAPSVRVSIGELFGAMPGTDLEGKLIAGLRQIGFDHVLDASFAADLVACEEAAELRAIRESGGRKLPLFTSCCPAWVRFAELYYPGLVAGLSTTKSPLQALATLTKTWFARKMDLDPARITVVTLSPCMAKKFELLRPEFQKGSEDGTERSRDIDFALTTRETAHLLKLRGVTRLLTLKDDHFDALPGEACGGGLLFGGTGGVCESTVRAAWVQINGGTPPDEFLAWTKIRSLDAVRTANFELGGKPCSVAVVHGMANFRPFWEETIGKGLHYDLIEVMACPGGCVGGGGQPRSPSGFPEDMVKKRIASLQRRDRKAPVRVAPNNPAVIRLYDEELKAPLSEQAITLLHIREERGPAK